VKENSPNTQLNRRVSVKSLLPEENANLSLLALEPQKQSLGPRSRFGSVSHVLAGVLGAAVVRRSLSFRDAMLTKELIRRFQATFDQTPEWAWPYYPSIPLIGSGYRSGRSILIYASAENLSWIAKLGQIPPARFTTNNAWNRYRVKYEAEGRNSPAFFPDVGIQPVNDGGLLAAGLFIARKLRLACPVRPRRFLEKIAVTNWCKFSIRSDTNHDYISDISRLTPSLPFVVGELAVLRPAVALMPNRVWKHPILSAAMRGASPETRFIPVPQFNTTVVNCHLTEYDRSARRLQRQSAGTSLAKWMAELRSFTPGNAWRYLAMLNEISMGQT